MSFKLNNVIINKFNTDPGRSSSSSTGAIIIIVTRSNLSGPQKWL